jgi:transglutaminase-like putative cysteine protease
MSGIKIQGSAVLAAAWLVMGAIAVRPSVAQALFVIPTDSPASATLTVADSQPLRIALHTRDATALAQVLGVKHPATETGVLEYVMRGYPAIPERTPRKWIEPTFVFDFLEPSVVRLSSEFATMSPKQSAPDTAYLDALTAFVAGKVRGTYDRGFDIASEVAVRREGDCKQFAVLTVALARADGVPARLVAGMALLRNGTRYTTFGHAWAELQIEGRWQVADAALAGAGKSPRYLPFGVLENEGMGYTGDLARLTSVWVQRVEVLGRVAGRQVSPNDY